MENLEKKINSGLKEAFDLLNNGHIKSGIKKALDIEHFIKDYDNELVKINAYHHLGYLYSQIAYARDDLDLCQRSISCFEYLEGKSVPLEQYYNYLFFFSRALLNHHNIRKNKLVRDGKRGFEFETGFYSVLMKSKKLHLDLLNGYFQGNKEVSKYIHYVLSNLAHIVAECNRWSEVSYYLDNSAFDVKLNSFRFYYKALTLDVFAEQTCSDENSHPSYYYTIYDLASKVLSDDIYFDERNFVGVKELQKDYKKKLDNMHVSLEKMKIHTDNIREEFLNFPPYRKFVLSENLALSDHAIYCNCNLSKSDDLKVLNQHVLNQHLAQNVEWVKKFTPLIEKLKAQFDIARRNYYRSKISINSSLELIDAKKTEYLVDSFKQCYSILDKIAIALVNIYKIHMGKKDIDHRSIYFHNVFFKTKLKDCFREDTECLYLFSLYSIAYDISDKEYAAFGQFKDWRNKIEHGYLFLTSEKCNLTDIELKEKYDFIDYFVGHKEFEEKTLLLLQFTRSAIFSLVYLLRRQTKYKTTLQ